MKNNVKGFTCLGTLCYLCYLNGEQQKPRLIRENQTGTIINMRISL